MPAPPYAPHPTVLTRFKRTRLLIVGCGDVGLRAVKALPKQIRVMALTSHPGRRDELRAGGLVPLAGNLDEPATLRRLAGLAHRVIHLAPPPNQGLDDPRTRALIKALKRSASPPKALVYGSTSGVYGDCAGALINETRALNPQTPRARRRAAAEQALRHSGLRVSILRIPGIYAPDRPGGIRERLLAGTPALRPEDDVFTSHIHADDLARACVKALWLGAPQRVYQAADDTRMRLGDYLDAAAGHYGLPRPPRISRAEAEKKLTPERMSFLRESRRLDNTRLKRELRFRLHHPQVQF